MAAKPRQLIGVTPVATGLLDNTAGRITFWSFTETTGAASAHVQLWDGSSAGGGLIADITLLAGQSTRDGFTPHALPYETGLFLTVVSGSINAQVYAVPENEWHQCTMPVELVNIGQLDVSFGATG